MQIFAVQKIPQIFAIFFAVIIALRKYDPKKRRKYLQISIETAKKGAKKAKNTYGSLLSQIGNVRNAGLESAIYEENAKKGEKVKQTPFFVS